MRLRMNTVKALIHVAPDGSLTGRVTGLPAGEHEAEITVIDTEKRAARAEADTLLARIRVIQEEVARLPVRDQRSPDEIIGYNDRGHLD
jgi:hypothetical protein